jgi:hypothetical protein
MAGLSSPSGLATAGLHVFLNTEFAEVTEKREGERRWRSSGKHKLF